jgi:hypothetical protein
MLLINNLMLLVKNRHERNCLKDTMTVTRLVLSPTKWLFCVYYYRPTFSIRIPLPCAQASTSLNLLLKVS